MVTLRIRNVPDDVRARFEMHAATSGLPLSEFMLQRLAALVDFPLLDEAQATIDAARRPRSRRAGR